MAEIDGAVGIGDAATLLRDLVNTVEWQVDVDTWNAPADLSEWFAARTGWTGRDLDTRDLDLAKDFREGLRSVFLMHAGHPPLKTSIEQLSEVFERLPARLVLSADGAVGLSSINRSGTNPLSLVLEWIDSARMSGDWMRLKACSRDSCRWVYWDATRNRSGRWCSMAGCGNYVKMRRRDHPGDVAGETVVVGPAFRPPTMVDVAARAGVSAKTVSNVITGAAPVTAATRSKVESALADLDYRLDEDARALRSKHRPARSR